MELRIVLAGILIGLFTACRHQVDVVYPEEKSITESVYASATIKPAGEYYAASSVPGILSEVFVEEGSDVAVGQPLFKLESETGDISISNARLAYDQALKNYKGSASLLKELRLEIETAAETLALDSVNYYRQKSLWEQNIGSRSALDQKQLSYYTSRNRLLSAKNRYHQMETELSNQVELARNQFDISRLNQSEFVVRSKSEGRVYHISKAVGEFVNQQEGLAMIGHREDFIIELQVDERDIARVEKGQKVLITMDSYKGEAYEATVTKVVPMMNEQSQTFIVEAVFVQRPKKLYPNLSAEANVIIETKEKAIVIPKRMLLDGNHVLLANGEKREVTLGIGDLDEVEVISGLNVSDELQIPD